MKKYLLLMCAGSMLMPTSGTALAQQRAAVTTSAAQRLPGQARLPFVNTPQDVDRLTDLTPEEKELAKKSLPKITDTEGWRILGNDPELQLLWQTVERVHMGLLDDYQCIPFELMHLISLQASRYSGSEYMVGFFTLLTRRQVEAYNLPADYAVKATMLEFPDSPSWTKEERLTLKFAEALFENTMTDELFNEARAAWGEKKLLRAISWASYVYMWGMTANALDLKYHPDLSLKPQIILTPDVVQQKIAGAKKMQKQMLDFYANRDRPSGRD